MTSLRPILAGILLYAVVTLWVRERWAACGVEAAAFLCAAWVLARVAWRRQRVVGGVAPALFTGMCLWGVAQLAAHWTVVPGDTADAVRYWLAAACFTWLGLQSCAVREERQAFLKVVLASGSTVCLLGLVQFFTSDGRVFWLFPSGYESGVVGPFVSRNNYAALVELLLPAALALAFLHRRQAKGYLVLAAALVASVIASGSRAGTMIVLAEAALAFLLQARTGRRATGRGWLVFAVLVPAFTLIAGYQYVWERFSDQDPFEFRREFVQSSAAMVRAEPLHGFGLGAWPSAYRQYAVIDTGLPANHAHNEWVQWAAEGGLPAAGLMLAAVALCAAGAVRSIWGLGILAVFLHSLVDYPFLRLGLAAWIFVMIGALSGYSRERRRLEGGNGSLPGMPGPLVRGLALAAVPILAFAAYQSERTAWADSLYRRGTPAAVARAANLRPDRAEYQFALAQADPDQAIRHLRRALALNPFLTEARTLLAAQLELAGDAAGSEAELLEGAGHDRQYAPAWALTNFYFRAGRTDRFWPWARAAAQVSPGGMRPLFELCFALSGDAATVLDRVVAPRRMVEREYLEFLIDRSRLADAYQAALRIAPNAGLEDREFLLDYVDRALDAGQFEGAADVWNELCLRRLAPYPPIVPGTLVNGDFSQPILNRGFDWRAAEPGCALAAQTHTDGAALELFLSGQRPESCEVYHQFVRLAAGEHYVLRFQYRTMELADPTGLRWSLGTGQDFEFRAAPEWANGEWRWQAAKAAGRVALAYRRNSGSTRREGTVLVRRVRLEADGAPRLSLLPAHAGER
jgi:O-antigen ligase